MTAPSRARSILIVLDGFGIGKDSPFNAINNAKMPFYKDLTAKYPMSQLITHGEAVGLPAGVMGNSEVGHMTMGAGRIVYQDLSRISKSIRDKDFFTNSVILEVLRKGASSRVHLFGLLSDGGVHSHIEHLEALLELCMREKIPNVSVHVITDGRDTPPNSGLKFAQRLLAHPIFAKGSPTRALVASLSGRYYAMDRDKRWERVERGYKAMTGQAPAAGVDLLAAIQKSYDAGKTDEFIEPVCLDVKASMKSGDSAFFFNYRSDRAREISQAIFSEKFAEFDRGTGFKPAFFAGMTVYEKNFPIAAAFNPQNLDNIFGKWLEAHSLKQFRIAETEKYAHVTFFFNGGREVAFAGEDRVLIPSPRDVATYDLKPEMSAFQVAEEASKRIATQAYDFVLMNFANADMVGHTGNYEAAVRAMEALDKCLSQVIGAAEKNGYHVIVTADHGNAEEMRDAEGHIHTQHTLNPVPAIWIAPDSANAPRTARPAMRDGTLEDIMPTLCKLMGLGQPKEATGKSLC